MRHRVHPAVCISHLRPLTKPRNDRSRSKEPPQGPDYGLEIPFVDERKGDPKSEIVSGGKIS